MIDATLPAVAFYVGAFLFGHLTQGAAFLSCAILVVGNALALVGVSLAVTPECLRPLGRELMPSKVALYRLGKAIAWGAGGLLF